MILRQRAAKLKGFLCRKYRILFKFERYWIKPDPRICRETPCWRQYTMYFHWHRVARLTSCKYGAVSEWVSTTLVRARRTLCFSFGCWASHSSLSCQSYAVALHHRFLGRIDLKELLSVALILAAVDPIQYNLPNEALRPTWKRRSSFLQFYKKEHRVLIIDQWKLYTASAHKSKPIVESYISWCRSLLNSFFYFSFWESLPLQNDYAMDDAAFRAWFFSPEQRLEVHE